MKHLPNLLCFSKKDLLQIIKLGVDIKKNPANYSNALKGKTLVMWFEKPSLRTRISFEAGMTQLGGHAIYLDVSTMHNKAKIKDEVKCLCRYCDIMMARVYDHNTINGMMEASSVPVINGLSNLYHPCQALADIMTIFEHMGKDAVIAYVGDGNNVCNSLVNAANIFGMKIKVATPAEYKPLSKPEYWTSDPREAVRDADVVYTDTWVSMGQESEKETKIKKLKEYQVNKKLIGERYFMHCLPATRGSEVTDEVIDSKKSLVYDQAENRLHIQKAIMIALLK